MFEAHNHPHSCCTISFVSLFHPLLVFLFSLFSLNALYPLLTALSQDVDWLSRMERVPQSGAHTDDFASQGQESLTRVF